MNDFHWTTCHKCKVRFAIPMGLEETCRANHDVSMYCPYGHEQVYPDGESAEDKLRRENQRLVQQLAQKDDDIAAVRKHARRLERRVRSGVCPCCNRTFVNMARHMKTKHKDFKLTAVA